MENRGKFLLGVVTGAALTTAVGGEVYRRVEATHSVELTAAHRDGFREGVCEVGSRGFIPPESNFPDDGTHDLHASLRECGVER